MRYCRSCQTTYPNDVLACPKDGNATTTLTAQDPYIGKFAGSYQITEKLGEGGMGVVYIAKHPTLGKKAAVKFLHASTKDMSKAIERFFAEAQIVSQLGHENIVDVYDFGLLDESQPYLVMEFLEGQSLSSLQSQMGPLEPKLALSIMLQLLDALSAAHKRGVIHRDLKPDNIFLLRRRDRYFVKLLDFGIAKLGDDSDLDSKRKHLTKTGMVIGTPHYMSPEQAQGLPLDGRSDLYSVGVLLFELLCGRPPFLGSNMPSLALAHVSKAPPAPRSLRPELPAVLEGEILRALSKQPQNRHQSADEMARALQASLVAPQPAPAPPEPPTQTAIQTTAKSESSSLAHPLFEIPTAALPKVEQAQPPVETPPPIEVEAPAPVTSAPPAPRASRRLWLGVGLGSALLSFALVWSLTSTPAPPKEPPTPSTIVATPKTTPSPVTAPVSAPVQIAPVVVQLQLAAKLSNAEVKIVVDDREVGKMSLPYLLEVPQGASVELSFLSGEKRWKKKLTATESTEIVWVPKEPKDKDNLKGTLPLKLPK